MSELSIWFPCYCALPGYSVPHYYNTKITKIAYKYPFQSSDICTALKMSTTTALLLVCLCVMEVCVSAAEVTKLQIGVKKKVKDCARRSRKGWCVPVVVLD